MNGVAAVGKTCSARTFLPHAVTTQTHAEGRAAGLADAQRPA